MSPHPIGNDQQFSLGVTHDRLIGIQGRCLQSGGATNLCNKKLVLVILSHTPAIGCPKRNGRCPIGRIQIHAPIASSITVETGPPNTPPWCSGTNRVEQQSKLARRYDPTILSG